MAPHPSRRNTQKIGRQSTLLKDQGKQPQGIETEGPQLPTVTQTTSTPSPTSNTSGKEFPPAANRKRKRSQDGESSILSTDTPSQKRPRVSPPRSISEHGIGKNTVSEEDELIASLSREQDHLSPTIPQSNRIDEATTLAQTSYSRQDQIAHWVSNSSWLSHGEFVMAETVSKKRRTETTHRSDLVRKLDENGIHMSSSAGVLESSIELCRTYKDQSRAPLRYTPFPLDQLPKVLNRVQHLNESRIQRDITPWIVPPAETLFYCGELDIDYIGDEVNAVWIRCATMGSTRPKPDYTAGLLPHAFTKDEREKLIVYATPDNPFQFTPEISFPFLICEAKSGEQGLNKADRQNIHSASIAVRAITSLYQIAYGSSDPQQLAELYGQFLVFTISHDHDRVLLYGHYALKSTTSMQPECFRHTIGIYSISADNGLHVQTVSNFVRNVYDKFAPVHRQRIQNAVKLLPKCEPTALSLGTSELALEETDVGQDSLDALSESIFLDTQSESQEQDSSVFKRPRLPASRQKEDAKLKQQMESQQKQSQEQINKLLAQLNRQSEDACEQRKQLELQRKQIELQMEQQRELLALVKQKSM